MIVFDLECECGCTFEGWFHNRRHFEKQLADSYLECPQCGSRRIRKILSPVCFRSSTDAEPTNLKKTAAAEVTAEEAEKALKILQKYVKANFEDVGAELAKEAMKMHYGVTESRNIRGVATESEEEKLKEEGIIFLKVPMWTKNEKAQ